MWSCRSSASATTPGAADSRTVIAADVDRALAALGAEVDGGQRRRRQRDDVLRLPGRDRHRIAQRSATTTSACCCSATSAIASISTCSVPGSRRRRAPTRRPGPASPSARPTRRLRRISCDGLALRPLLGLARVGSYAAEGSGEIGLAFIDRSRARRSRTTISTRYFVAAYESAHEAVYNCLVAASPGTLRDGTMQDPFPIELVRRLAKREASSARRVNAQLRDEVDRAGTRPDPARHLESTRQRDAGCRAGRCLPRARRGRVRARRP